MSENLAQNFRAPKDWVTSGWKQGAGKPPENFSSYLGSVLVLTLFHSQRTLIVNIQQGIELSL